jgi:hypothetical protein
METAVVWLLVIGPLFIGLGAAIYWGSGNDLIGLWTGVAGVFALVIAAALQAQTIISRPEAVTTAGPSDAEINRQRAYVLVEASEMRFVTGDKPSEGWVSLKNNGLTPAFELERWATIFAAKFPQTAFERAKFSNARSVLGPGGAVDFGPIRMSRNLTFAEAEQVARGTMAIYVYGEVRYRDIYNVTRCTNFRLMYRGTGGRPAGAVPLQQLPDGNNYDCSKEP